MSTVRPKYGLVDENREHSVEERTLGDINGQLLLRWAQK